METAQQTGGNLYTKRPKPIDLTQRKDNRQQLAQDNKTRTTNTDPEADMKHHQATQATNQGGQDLWHPGKEHHHPRPKGLDHPRATNKENKHHPQEANIPAATTNQKADPGKHHHPGKDQGTTPGPQAPPPPTTIETAEGNHHPLEKHHPNGDRPTTIQAGGTTTTESKEATVGTADQEAPTGTHNPAETTKTQTRTGNWHEPWTSSSQKLAENRKE